MSKASRKYKTFEELGEAQGHKPTKEEKKDDLQFSPCVICQKQIGEGYYARYGNGGVCSAACMKLQDAKPKYPSPHDEESFLRRQGETFDEDCDIMKLGE